MAFGVGHNEAEGFGVDARQFGNVARDLATIRPLPPSAISLTTRSRLALLIERSCSA
jgi:hypothetical protein